jgi:hypothetical protein
MEKTMLKLLKQCAIEAVGLVLWIVLGVLIVLVPVIILFTSVSFWSTLTLKDYLDMIVYYFVFWHLYGKSADYFVKTFDSRIFSCSKSATV